MRWSEAPWVTPGALLNIDHAFYPPGFAFPHHRHDYAEFFLVTDGSGWHRDATGTRPLAAGDCAFIDPRCSHHLAADGATSLVFTNVAIRGDRYRDLAQRYRGHWPWPEPEAVRIHRLASRDRHLLERLIAELTAPRATGDPLAVDALITTALAVAAGARRETQRPAWLQRWLEHPEDPDILHGGVAAVARRAGCSREHVNRSVRRHCGCTARDLLTSNRLALAAQRLRASEDPIVAIAADCGFGNLANFYRLFGREYGLPPKRYRDRKAGFV